jgi:putative sigma-54 modulation protein
MEVHLLARQFPLTPALRRHLERRLCSGFSFARNRLGDVVVRVGDASGARGERDMLCQILIAVPGRPTVVVRDVQEDLYTAIDRAVKRAAYKLRQLVMQWRYLERWGCRSPSSARREAARALSGADT